MRYQAPSLSETRIRQLIYGRPYILHMKRVILSTPAPGMGSDFSKLRVMLRIGEECLSRGIRNRDSGDREDRKR
jgi:hypothetical protein